MRDTTRSRRACSIASSRTSTPGTISDGIQKGHRRGDEVAVAASGVATSRPRSMRCRSRVYVTGFCYGGAATWMAAAHCTGLKAASCFYGRLIADLLDHKPQDPDHAALRRARCFDPAGECRARASSGAGLASLSLRRRTRLLPRRQSRFRRRGARSRASRARSIGSRAGADGEAHGDRSRLRRRHQHEALEGVL